MLYNDNKTIGLDPSSSSFAGRVGHHTLAIDACLEKIREEVRVSKGIVRGFTRKEDLHSSWK